MTPCPICGAPGGFHDDGPHDAIKVPEHLVRKSNNALRRERKET